MYDLTIFPSCFDIAVVPLNFLICELVRLVNSTRDNKKSFLVITHYQRLLNFIKPDFVHVLADGKIIKSGTKELAMQLEKTGYKGIN